MEQIDTRDSKIDIVKGIAIYLVVLGHLLNSKDEILNILITACHMPVFFYISGYLFSHSYYKYGSRKFINKKVSSLLVPYFFWSCISLIANVSTKIPGGGYDIIREFVDIFILARSVWFLEVLFVTNLIFLGLMKLHEKSHCNLPLLCFLIWIIGLVIFRNNQFLSIYKFEWLFPYFCIGFFCNETKKKAKNVNSCKAFGGIVGYCIFTLLIYHKASYVEFYGIFDLHINTLLHYIAYYIAGILGIIIVYAVADVCEKYKIGKYTKKIGCISIDIYVIHMFFIKIIRIFSNELMEKQAVYNYCIAPILALCTVLLIFLMVRYVLSKFKIYNYSVGKININFHKGTNND